MYVNKAIEGTAATFLEIKTLFNYVLTSSVIIKLMEVASCFD